MQLKHVRMKPTGAGCGLEEEEEEEEEEGSVEFFQDLQHLDTSLLLLSSQVVFRAFSY
jgi:hypothetical protein